jgi:alcohol dehydrogenase class IV
MTDAVCREGLDLMHRSLRKAHDIARRLEVARDPVLTASEQQARADIAVASMFSGMALANSGLGAVHGFAGVIGGMFNAPHGALCAALLPHVFEMNWRCLKERMPASPILERFNEIGRRLTGMADADATAAIEWMNKLVTEFAIPGLAVYGIAKDHISKVVQNAARSSSMKGNPIALTEAEMCAVLERSLR